MGCPDRHNWTINLKYAGTKIALVATKKKTMGPPFNSPPRTTRLGLAC